MMRRSRSGFALILTLWALTVVAVVGIAVVLSARESYNVARNRYAAERAYWLAEGCLNVVRASIDDLLAGAPSPDARTRRWRALDSAASAGLTVDPPCRVKLSAAGDRLDVNSASEDELRRLLTRLAGVSRAPELVDALLDWRDADRDTRPFGAEADWYEAQYARVPRDGAFASIDELRRVRGFEQIGGLDTLFSVEPGRLSIATAPIAVLAAAPGLTDETLARIAEMRADGRQLDDLIALTALIPPSAVESLMVRYADLVYTTTLDPDAWIVSATVACGTPPLSATSEIRIVRKGTRTAVARRRNRS